MGGIHEGGARGRAGNAVRGAAGHHLGARSTSATGALLAAGAEGGVDEIFRSEDIAKLAAARSSQAAESEAEQQAYEIF